MSAPIARFFFFLFILTGAQPGLTQQRMKGFVYNKKNNEPVSYASVVSSTRGIGSMTDTSGIYSFWYPRQIRTKDSVTISAIGYISTTMSLRDLADFKDVYLDESSAELENVIVVATLKGDHRRFTYFRSWNESGTGGEIGEVIDLPKMNLVLGFVQVKINQNYDTCWLKLHIRAVGSTPTGGRIPEEELLKDDIIVPATVKYGLLEFDLSDKNIKLRTNKIYVGFEVLGCKVPQSDIPTFCFMGSEEGENIFRDTINTEWDTGGRYTIYIRLLLK